MVDRPVPPAPDGVGWTPVVWRYLRDQVGPGLTRRLGGPLGRHAGTVGGAWAFVVATVSWLVCMLRQLPCWLGTPDASPDRFRWMCYTDITALYFSRGQGAGGLPYDSVQWEYPVLTGYFATVANWIGQVFGARLTPQADGQQLTINGNIYFAVTAVGLYLCLVWLISSLLRLAPGMPGVALAVAISPTLWATGLINWDLLAVSLTLAGLASWQAGKPVWAGAWWGLGVAAKLYPLVIVGALVVVCLRPDTWRDLKHLGRWAVMALTAALTWLVVNLPVMVYFPTGWKYFYTMNADRVADLGSLWYALDLARIGSHPVVWSRALMIAGYVLLALLIWLAPQAPSPAQIAYLAVCVMVVGNLVYSPQYVLWVLPLVMLARPRLADWWIFTVSELVYFWFIWVYLDGHNLSFGVEGAPPWIYIGSIVVRLAGTVWVMSRVVRDIVTGRGRPADVVGVTQPATVQPGDAPPAAALFADGRLTRR